MQRNYVPAVREARTRVMVIQVNFFSLFAIQAVEWQFQLKYELFDKCRNKNVALLQVDR